MWAIFTSEWIIEILWPIQFVVVVLACIFKFQIHYESPVSVSIPILVPIPEARTYSGIGIGIGICASLVATTVTHTSVIARGLTGLSSRCLSVSNFCLLTHSGSTVWRCPSGFSSWLRSFYRPACLCFLSLAKMKLALNSNLITTANHSKISLLARRYLVVKFKWRFKSLVSLAGFCIKTSFMWLSREIS